MAISTSIKGIINAALNPIGFSLGTTLVERTEKARLNDVEARGHWDAPRYYGGLRLDPERYLKFLADVVAPYREDCLAFPTEADDANGGYYLQNYFFGGVDAEVLYGMVRHRKPNTIVEVGSGYSTRIMTQAIRDGSLPTRVISIDPAPRTRVDDVVDERLRYPVEHLSFNRITERLGAGDILFVDSSHLIAPGGDVTFLLLEVLPRLEPGVIVHLHDIFLPYDYPKLWIKDHRWKWTEQYLVHGFLSFNSAFEILWPSNFMWQRFPGELRQVMPRGATTLAIPASLWIERTR